MSNLTDALIAAKLVGGSGGSGGGSGLPSVTSDDNGDVLTVVDGAWGKAAPSADVFHLKIVETFTPDDPEDPDSDGTYSYALDKTGAEIDAAINAGKVLYCDGMQGSDVSFDVKWCGVCVPTSWSDGVGSLFLQMTVQGPETRLGAFTPKFANDNASDVLHYNGRRMGFRYDDLSGFAYYADGVIICLVEPFDDDPSSFDVALRAIDGQVGAVGTISSDAETGDKTLSFVWSTNPEVPIPAFYGDGSSAYKNALEFRLKNALLMPKGLEDFNSHNQNPYGECLMKYIVDGAFNEFTL